MCLDAINPLYKLLTRGLPSREPSRIWLALRRVSSPTYAWHQGKEINAEVVANADKIAKRVKDIR